MLGKYLPLFHPLHMKKLLPILLLLLLAAKEATAQQAPAVLPLRERASLEDDLLRERLEKLLPDLMRRAGIDMWLVVAREYNEDPVAKTMLPATWLGARRRTILLFYDRGAAGGIKKLAVARYNIGNLMQGVWAPEQEPNQWKRLAQLVSERSPRKVGLNYSPLFAHADGLTKAEYDSLLHYLPPAQRQAVV